MKRSLMLRFFIFIFINLVATVMASKKHFDYSATLRGGWGRQAQERGKRKRKIPALMIHKLKGGGEEREGERKKKKEPNHWRFDVCD